MNKGMKVCLIGGLTCLLVGTAISMAALAMGADPRGYNVWDDSFQFSLDWDPDQSAAQASFEDVSNLDIDCDASEVLLEVGEVDQVTVKVNAPGRFSWKVAGNTLKIASHRHGWRVNGRSRLVLQVPEGFVWDDVRASVNAGSFAADSLTANTVDLVLNAGSMTIESGTIGRLSADVAAGQIVCGAAVQGNAKLECAAGGLRVLMQGIQEDYHTDVECQAGTVKVGSYYLTALAGDRDYYKDGGRDLKIDCSAGEVIVEFTD